MLYEVITIESLEGVKTAIVTLDIPESKNTVISTTTQKSRASVTVHLEEGKSLKNDQIKGITRLVMMSVSDLTEENITIADGTGKLLIADEDEEKLSTDVDNVITSYSIHYTKLYDMPYLDTICG